MKGFALLVALLVPGALQAQTFVNPVQIPTSSSPISVFTTDLNGDGLPDLLYETSGLIAGSVTIPSTMQTLLAQPSGGYVAGPTTTLPLLTGACRPADFNHDGKQDLVCLHYIDDCTEQAVAMAGNGDGSFQSPVYSGVMHSNCFFAPFYAWLYSPADVNADSNPDLMVGDGYNFDFFVLLGDGNGHFNVSFVANPASVQVGYGGEMGVADLNGDGKPDLVTSYGPYVWLGNGDGTFTYKGDYGSYNSCTLNDIEANGHPDAICTNKFTQSGTMSYVLDILHGNPDGSFAATPVSSTLLKSGLADLTSPTAISDLNGDGLPDILGSSSDGLSVLFGEPNLKFSPPMHYSVGTFAAVGGTTSQVADLNNDGSKDIASIGSGGLYLTYGKGNGGYSAPAGFSVANLLGQITMADFNGDGNPDIVATGDPGIEVSLGKGDGTFTPFVAQPNGAISFGQSNLYFMQIAHGDFRGDGHQDLLAIGNSGTNGFQNFAPYVLFGNGDGTFMSPEVVNNLEGIWTQLYPGAVGDFNHDGRDDLLSVDQNAVSAFHAYVALSNGDGSFTTVATPLAIETGPTISRFPSPTFADFDKDGNLDLALVQGGYAFVFRGKGDGSFQSSATPIPIPPFLGQSLQYSPLAVAAGDFDGDGNTDFAVLAQVGGYVPPPAPNLGVESAVYVFYGNGDGTFSSPVVSGGYDEMYDTLYAADLDKDGRSDLILQDTGTMVEFPSNSVAVVLSRPDRLFGPETIYTAGVVGTSAVVADLNRDGYPDLLVSNSSPSNYSGANSVTELLNVTTRPPTRTASTTSLIASPPSFAAGSSVTFTATVSGPPGTIPTGSVRFADQTGNANFVPLTTTDPGPATISFTTNKIGVGPDTIEAAYSGDSILAPSRSTVQITASGLPTIVTFTVTPNPAPLNFVATFNVTVQNPAGSSAAVPAGYIEFLDGSTIIGGPITLSNGSAVFDAAFSTVGTHTLAVRYSGDLVHVPSTTTLGEAVEVAPSIALNAPSTITTAQALPIAIAVNGGAGNPAPTGVVTVSISSSSYDPGTVLGSATLSDGAGSITAPAGSLALGTHWLSATYTPDAASSPLYLASGTQGTYVSVTAPVPTFTITGTPVTLSAGATTGNTSIVTVTPANGFTGIVNLTASITSGPNNAAYPPIFSFGSAAASVNITGTSAATATLIVLSTPSRQSALPPAMRRNVPWYASGGFVLAGVFLWSARRNRSISLALVAFLFVATGGGFIACGGSGGSRGSTGAGNSNPGTTLGTYTVTVTGTSATASASGAITITVN